MDSWYGAGFHVDIFSVFGFLCNEPQWLSYRRLNLQPFPQLPLKNNPVLQSISGEVDVEQPSCLSVPSNDIRSPRVDLCLGTAGFDLARRGQVVGSVKVVFVIRVRNPSCESISVLDERSGVSDVEKKRKVP